MATTNKADVEKAVSSGTEKDAASDKTLVGSEADVEAARSQELEAQLKAAIAEKEALQAKLAKQANARVSATNGENRERRSVKNPGTVVRSFDEDGNVVEAKS